MIALIGSRTVSITESKHFWPQVKSRGTAAAPLSPSHAFWPHDLDSSDPDAEVIAAIKPGMSTVPNAMMLCASSPYSRRGALWEAHHRHFGKDGDEVLVWQAATRDMNPSVPQAFIDKHMAEDPSRAAAKYSRPV
jgi:hypothetical protein